MRYRSIRFRLTVWYTAVLAAGLVLFSVLVWVSLRHQLMADIERELEGRANRLENYFRAESAKPGVDLPDELEEFCQALSPDSYVILHGAGGFSFEYPVLNSSAAAAGKAAAEIDRTKRGGASEIRMVEHRFTLNNNAFDLKVGEPTEDVARVLQLLRYLLWSLIPVVIAIACAGGAWLSGRVLKPVQDVTDAALLISIENLSDRVPVPQTGDEIARLAEVLNSMLARLESAVKTLSQFVADASHELRTPLAVIRTTAELALRRGRTPESYRESLHDVVREAERMTRLVEELLVLARSDAEVAQMPREALDAREILQDVSAEIQHLADSRQIFIQTHLGETAATISANRPALHRLFLVLLDNAVKYSPAGGRVAVSIQNAGETVAVSIQDFGRGIPKTDLPRIFERFYRADTAPETTPVTLVHDAGHGLGLPLAESIAKAHGAFIEVESAEGQGSIFRVVFSARLAEPERQIAAAKAPARV